MLGLLADLGFEANEAKCDGPSRVQVFLGVGMNSLTMQYFFTAERLERMRRACLDLEHASGSVRVSRIMSVVGQWGFLATIVPGLARLLSHLTQVGGVRTVVPGRIARASSRPGGGLRVVVRIACLRIAPCPTTRQPN